jgi:sortase B
MSKTKKIIYIIVIMLLITTIAISSHFILKQVLQEQKQDKEFEQLEEIINIPNEEDTTDNNTEEKNNNNTNKRTKIDLQKLKNINSDIVGWIKIDGTNINYPVMQNEDYYLRRNFYKQYSTYGTPFIASYCDINKSDNSIIYGHHMNNHKMFADLEYYKNKSFYNNHKYIKLYTLEDEKTIENTYEVIFAFKTVAYSNKGFNYSSFYNANTRLEYCDFISKCKELELYNTNNSAVYGDKLLTLSTCEYSQKNGRMVVVAKKI